MANWFIASVHSLAERLQSAVMFFSAIPINVVAASSLRKCPRVLMILRNRALTLSIAFVVQITRRTAGGKAKNGITRSHARRQSAAIVGYRSPQDARSNSSSASRAVSALVAV